MLLRSVAKRRLATIKWGGAVIAMNPWLKQQLRLRVWLIGLVCYACGFIGHVSLRLFAADVPDNALIPLAACYLAGFFLFVIYCWLLGDRSERGAYLRVLILIAALVGMVVLCWLPSILFGRAGSSR